MIRKRQQRTTGDCRSSSVIKNRLFKAYCSSFYGCEIWDLNNTMIEFLCIAWRKGGRRVWLLPRDSANEIVYLIADVVPIFNEICRRAMNFIFTCYQLGSELVSRGLYFEHYELINRP